MTTNQEIGEIQVSTAEPTFTFKLFALAALGDEYSRSIQLLSAAGPHTSVMALHACLHGGHARPTFRAKGGQFEWHHQLCAAPAGYHPLKKQKLAGCYGWYHILMLAKTPGLLPVVDDAALWDELNGGERYTTPMLRPWVPWLEQTLLKGEKLKLLDCFQCQVGLLDLPPEDLDAAVCTGVEFGALEIK